MSETDYLLNLALAKDGLTTQQVLLMATIMREDTPPSLTTCASRVRVSYQNIKQMADLLVRKGFLEMERNPADKRMYELVPTEHSDRVFERRLQAKWHEGDAWTRHLKGLAKQLGGSVGEVVSALDRLSEAMALTEEDE